MKTSISAAHALVAIALASVPGLTLDGLDSDGPPLDSPTALRQVAAAADLLLAGDRLHRTIPRSTTTIVGELAADRAGLLQVSSGAVLAAAIGLGFNWRQVDKGPHAQLAFRPPPPWLPPAPEHAVQAVRRCMTPVEVEVVVDLMRRELAGSRGRRPPTQVVLDAIDEAVAAGQLLADHEGRLSLAGQGAAA